MRLAWLDSTGDLLRRISPRTPEPHLVSYFLLIDHHQDAILLVDHRKARQASCWQATPSS
jgi:8-oxo-dGTP diphosphatase